MTAPLKTPAVAKTQATLELKGIPTPRAEVKAESTVVGKMFARTGVGLIVLAGVLALKLELTAMAVIVIALIAALGFGIFAVSMTLISREAAPAIDAIGELFVKVLRAIASVVRAIRGKNGHADA